MQAAGPEAVNKWRTQPIGGEIRPEVWGCVFDDPSCAPKGQAFDACVQDTHVSWLMDSGVFRKDFGGASRQRALEAVRKMGYEFHVTEARIENRRDGMELTVHVRNTGIAPFYYAWPVEIGRQTLDGRMEIHKTPWDIRNILPGDNPVRWRVQLPADDRGKLMLRVVNPLAGGVPLHFANRTRSRDKMGWLLLRAESKSSED
jgi:hypothetical protein